MAQTETLPLIQQIQSLVTDKLQVVSYKWLSRNYMVSSDEAKRLLQELVQNYGGGSEVIYALSGWLKRSDPCYHIRLVTGPKLQEAQQEFDGNCSIQVYSVQAIIPKDPAVLWNAEFIQAEELFKQPSSVDNCLRDNRFCGLSSSFDRRNVDGPSVVPAAAQTKSAVPTKSNTVHQINACPQSQKNKAHDSIPAVELKSLNLVKDVKSESNGTGNTGVHDHINKPADKPKVLPLPTGKKKVQADKGCSVSGGSLACFWARASAKPEPCSMQVENEELSNPTATADTQICVREAGEVDNSDDDSQEVTVRRSCNSERSRKRRVVLDFSDEDEYEDAIILASPDFPNKQSSQDHRNNYKSVSEKATLNFDVELENKSKVKEEKAADTEANQPWREDFSVISKCTSIGKLSVEKSSFAPEFCVNKGDCLNNAATGSPKRRKVMKTVIDERGREVTKVVWEGEETEEKKADNVTVEKADNDASRNAVKSAPATKKSSALANATSNPTGKGGSRKAGNSKELKQGNILSFFKKDLRSSK